MPWSYRPALDGLRSVAVYLVLLFHSGLAAVGGGFIGVDLFFVLSGFLVSNVILSEIDANGRLDLGRFYARRVRRLLPAAVVVVAATSVVFLLVFPAVRRLTLVGDAQSALLYFANWNFLFQQNDYFAAGVDESPFLHFWSLAIEEQFYLFFPLLLVLLARVRRRRTPVTLGVLGTLLAASLGAQLFWAGRDMNWAYYGTDARLYQLMAGAVLAVMLRSVTRRPSPAVAGLGALLGIGGLLVLGSGLLDVSPSVRGIGATAASVLAIGGLMTSETGLPARLLSRPTPVYLGKISYGTYLWHWPVILVVEHVLDVRPLVVAVLAGTLSTSLAALSFAVLEHPIRSTPLLRPFRWTVVVAGVATSALVAATVVPPVLESNRRPSLVQAASLQPSAPALPPGVTVGGVSARERNAPVPNDIDWRTTMGTSDRNPLCGTDDLESCLLVDGDGPHVLLVGDSYGKMFTPMFTKLAKEKGFKLSHNALPGCPWQSDLVLTRLPESRLDACLAQRNEWYDEVLPKLDVDLVVLTSIDRDGSLEEGGTEAATDGPSMVRIKGPSDESTAELMFDTTMETVRQIRAAGPRVLIIQSLPVPKEGDPLSCLGTATRLSQCELVLPEEDSASDSYYRVAAATIPDVYTVDLLPIFCYGMPRCMPVVDGVSVWGDRNHLSVEYTQMKRAEVWKAIQRSGAFAGFLASS